MIRIGLTGWGDHPSLYSGVTASKDKLFDYAGHFLTVEVDTSFYAIPSVDNVRKWCELTPDSFRFVIKAYQGMTGHLRGEIPFESKNDMFNAFIECANEFKRHGKLAMVLAQFPPWFDCQSKNVQYLLYIRQQLKEFNVAIEFRNRTWYADKLVQQTMDFLKEHQFIHTICDEPQAGIGSVPFYPEVTANRALVRIHGRNIHGWRNTGNMENWRKVRFLYDYNKEELQQLGQHIQAIQPKVQELFVLFNNNSGLHAAKNAKELQELLAIRDVGLAPKQLNMFEGEI
ncbi:hypothetical protein GY31_04715 [Lysinibacillus sphaericus]|uniref:DUF72 domain-containing protein n=1 Tax=Lysinibacillus sphaericus TaxID=1421 RepID=A0A2S5CWI3_LYSSH|nr:DUF72 domain-containing protein [Lysinibacillus sphaericus]OEC03016.1 hypothetical protein GY31_04715 [Lysinibacillus sphaericus]POZ55150.1 hypothetical protein LYSIN_03447 [Lysinibacillus sphaericus]